MIKNIGIRGHRGAGKNTLSYLLGTAIEYYTENGNFDGFEEVYGNAVERVREDENFIFEAEFKNVMFESFADAPKIMLTELIGIESDWAYDDFLKDNVFINIKNFEYHKATNKLDAESFRNEKRIYNSRELIDLCGHSITAQTPPIILEDTWTTLREAISYFSHIMKSAFGGNVWIKALRVNRWDKDEFFSGNKTKYRIYTDIKFSSEISYIKDDSGIIVKVTREDNVKEDTDISMSLKNDYRFDFEFEMKADLYEVYEQIIGLTLKIIQ